MAEENEIINDTERVEVAPAGGETVEVAPKEGGNADPDAAAPEGEVPEGHRPEEIVRRKPDAAAPEGGSEDGEPAGDGEAGNQEPKPVEGETPRERALRIKLADTQRALRKEKAQELGIGQSPAPASKKELPPEKQAVLKKYKPEEIAAFREVLPVIAEDMGFVRADQLTAQQYKERSQAELDGFLEKHPEYLPSNDKDGVLWDRFKQEFSIYAQPQNPKDYQKIFQRVHAAIFDIQPVGDRSAINAGAKKIQVASHAGASGGSRPASAPQPRASGVRLDILKGFSKEELENIERRAGGE